MEVVGFSEICSVGANFLPRKMTGGIGSQLVFDFDSMKIRSSVSIDWKASKQWLS